MNKQPFLALLTCVLLGATAVCDVRAQAGAAAPGGVGRAGGRGFFGRGQRMPPGPPAPVPPEVRIPRPALAEVNRMNADFKQFIETTPDKELLKKYESLLTVRVPRDNPCIRPAGGGMLSFRHSRFLDDKGGLIGFRTSNHLHPVEQGFEIWASAVAPTLKCWIE